MSGQATSAELLAFVVLQFTGSNIMLPFLILTFLCTRARRHPALMMVLPPPGLVAESILHR